MTRLLVERPTALGTVCIDVLSDACAHKADTIHAVARGDVWAWAGSSRKTCDTACGTRARPWLARSGERMCTVAWPPRATGLAKAGLSRCRDCHRATGQQRPRTEVAA